MKRASKKPSTKAYKTLRAKPADDVRAQRLLTVLDLLTARGNDPANDVLGWGSALDPAMGALHMLVDAVNGCSYKTFREALVVLLRDADDDLLDRIDAEVTAGEERDLEWLHKRGAAIDSLVAIGITKERAEEVVDAEMA